MRKQILSSLFFLAAALLLFSFKIDKPRKMESLSRYGEKTNSISNSKPEEEFGSGLNGLNQIGFFTLPLFDDKTKQIAFILWMKQRFEQLGHVIILDHANGIDFTGVAKGGWASIGSRTVPVHNFTKKTTTYIRDLQHLTLSVSASIRFEETKKLAPLESIWSQEMFVDASDQDNLEIGYKDLIENLISDLKASNAHYKQTPVFYLYIDTDSSPHLKKALEKFISPTLTSFPDHAVHLNDK